MDFITKIKNRYSVRSFDPDKKIPEEDYKKIIDVVNSAPTSSNWHSSSVVIIKDKELLEKISEFRPFTKHLKDAQFFMVFIADFNRMNLAQKAFPEYKYNNHSSEAYTVAVGDAFIQATMAQDAAVELGLSTCFIGGARVMVQFLIDILGIKGQAFPVVGLAIGYEKGKGTVKPKLNRVFEDKYDYERIKQDVSEYDKTLVEFFEKTSPDKKAWSYQEATVKSGSGYAFDTELIENIWDLKLQK
ncbi:nitroreductase family protein [Mycoplasmopsis agalactiae]|uniref:nitroreductase family protein n=1 Tax=Mycoplasmopsis agalactiae TaxID=2110 RepID=UPI00211BC07F|nr:nitroreductase family protein [Mycoplasmopsis agalactiae]UUM25275.1 nitroreductase family protein [Mycoplasmopsis agalactiae]